MSETLEIPSPFDELGLPPKHQAYVPQHYGHAWNFKGGADPILDPQVPDNYAARPFEEAFDTASLQLHIANMTPEERKRYDITAFYSRRRPGLNKKEVERFIAADVGAFAVAVNTDLLDFYFRGHEIEIEDSGIGPYDLPFTPSVLSSCGWPCIEDAQAAAATEEHLLASLITRECCEQVAIVKLKPVLLKKAGGQAVSIAFKKQSTRYLDFRLAA